MRMGKDDAKGTAAGAEGTVLSRMGALPEKYRVIWDKALPLLRQGRPGDDNHAAEVAWFILERAKHSKLDLDVLVPVAIMHDIGHSAILPEHFKYITGGQKLANAKLVHMFAGAKIANDILNEVGYDRKASAEIVDLISMHDMDQIKGVDLEKTYDTMNKKLFHDIDSLDRYTRERLESIKHLFPGKTFEELVELVASGLGSFFFDEFRDVAQERVKKLRGG